MVESVKLPNTVPATIQPSKTRRTAPMTKLRPTVVGTKASEARAKAIKTSQLTIGQPARKRKRPATDETNTLVKSYHTTASGLKQRPAWDLRGKVQDMTDLYELNLQRLEELNKHKREMEILQSEKESKEKDALQMANHLRAELVVMERNHQATISELHANQRLEYQKLEDENISLTRQINTIDIDVREARNRLDTATRQLEQVREENQLLKDTIEKTTEAYEKAVVEVRVLKAKLEKLGKSIIERKEEAQKKKSQIERIQASNQQLQDQLSQSQSKRTRLLTKIKNLEVSAAKNKKVVTKNLA